MIGGIQDRRVYIISINAHQKDWYLKRIELDKIGYKVRRWTTQPADAMMFELADEAEIVAMVALDEGENFQIKHTSKR